MRCCPHPKLVSLDDISTNSIETKTDLVLRTQTTNNLDYSNNIVFQNTGSYYNIALTRRYDTNAGSNKSNFCIQTGANGNISGLPIRLCVQNNGNVNIGSSQQKTHSFNVEGQSNFESSVTATSFIGPLTGNAATATKIDSITNSNKIKKVQSIRPSCGIYSVKHNPIFTRYPLPSSHFTQ